MIRKLKHLNVCLCKSYINNVINDYIINISICREFENNNELLEILNNSKFDLLITDYNFDLFKKIRRKDEYLQIFAILDVPSKQNLLESLELKHIKFIEDLNCEESFKESLIECIKNIDSNKSNIIKLKNNFTYDNYNKTLFYKNDIVQLSKKEGSFLNLLLENENRALDYDEINKIVWQGEMSQDALRSVVKELRKKTYKELVKNVSGVGYRLDSI